MKPKTLVILDMHGTALNSDIPMLEAITKVIKDNFGIVLNNYSECLEWLATQQITKQNALEGNKKEIFNKLLSLHVTNPLKNGNDLFREYEAALETKLIEAIQKDKLSPKDKRSVIPVGFEESVAGLHRAGVTLGFASNSSTKFLENVLHTMGLLEFFSPHTIIGSDKQPKDNTGAALTVAMRAVNGSGASSPVQKLIFVGDAAGDRRCLKGFQKTNPGIEAEFIMMQLPGRQIHTAPSAPNEISCSGFHSLSTVLNQSGPTLAKL